MSTLTRAMAKVMLKSLKAYTCLFDQVSRAVDPQKTGLKKAHPKLRDKLDECFISLYSDWHSYKDDLSLSDEDFNNLDEESSNPLFNTMMHGLVICKRSIMLCVTSLMTSLRDRVLLPLLMKQ